MKNLLRAILLVTGITLITKDNLIAESFGGFCVGIYVGLADE